MKTDEIATHSSEAGPKRGGPQARGLGSQTVSRVVACYSLLDTIMTASGFEDLTEGMFEGDEHRSYEAAQSRKAEVLLDRVGCGPGSRLLDIGCGYGRILKAAAARGAQATGITVCPKQARRGQRAGLDVRLQDYRHVGPEWSGGFDGVIANGSLEHFAQPADAAEGRDSDIYRDMFATVHRLLRSDAKSRRFVTTAIHVPRRTDPTDWLRSPSDFPHGSAPFHFARVTRAFGGWYPVPGQLEECARGYFSLVEEEDGTEDYRLTSEAWLVGVRKRLRSVSGLGTWLQVLLRAARRPIHGTQFYLCELASESWNWQFRGDPAPTMLLRQTWVRD